MTSSSKIRIGAVSYLNTKPLIESLEQSSERIELSLDLPSRLATDLVNGDLDVALIPSVETFRISGSQIVSDACIGCRGPVWSVKLISRKPFEEIRTIAMDEGSRTSIGLTQVLLRKKYGLNPILSTLPMDQQPEQNGSDAVLVIGDRAMHIGTGEFPYQWDLGDQWCRWTELPFVFAMWVTLDEHPDPDIVQALSDARDRGIARLGEIARREASGYGLTGEACENYLRHHLHYSIGSAERKALELFQSHLLDLNLIPESRNLKFHECQTS